MDDIRFGRAIRSLRRRLGLRQVDVAQRAEVTQSTVSLIERGRIDRLQVVTIRAVARTVGAEWHPDVRWRGGELDRLIDEDHAQTVAEVCRLAAVGWETRTEVTFSIYGERGSIDVLGWHAATRQLLVVEVKTALVSLEETLRRHDAKTRLARRIGRDSCAWEAVGVSSLLALSASSTTYRRVARHGEVLGARYPLREAALRRWLREPHGPSAGLMFIPAIVPGTAIHARRMPSRVRAAPGGTTPPGSPPLITPSDGRGRAEGAAPGSHRRPADSSARDDERGATGGADPVPASGAMLDRESPDNPTSPAALIARGAG